MKTGYRFRGQFSRLLCYLLCGLLVAGLCFPEAVLFARTTYDLSGGNVAYGYDANGRLQYAQMPDTSFIQYVYDPNGNVLRAAPSELRTYASTSLFGWDAFYAIDDQVGTAWSSQWHGQEAAEEWIVIDTGAVRFVGGINLTPRGLLSFPKDFRIEWSLDAQTWQAVPGQSYTGYVNDGGVQSFMFESSVVARYLRMYATKLGTDDWGGHYFQLLELEIVPAQAASSSNVSGWGAQQAVDGDLSKAWSSQWHGQEEAEEWIAIDTGAVGLIGGTNLTPRGLLSFPKDFRIEWSYDAQIWHGVPGQSYSDYVNDGGVQQFIFEDGVTARYLRMYATRLGTDDWGGHYFQLMELEIVPL